MAPPNTTGSGSEDPSTKMTKIQAQKVIEENQKRHLLEQIESALEEIKSEKESSDHTIQPVSLDFMVEDTLPDPEKIVKEIAWSKDFYQNLYVVPPRQPEGLNLKRYFQWARDVTFQESLRDELASSLVDNGRELARLNLDPDELLSKKIPYMERILVAIDMLKENHMIHNEGEKKLDLLRRDLKGKYAEWEAESTNNLSFKKHNSHLRESIKEIGRRKDLTHKQCGTLHITNSEQPIKQPPYHIKPNSTRR